MNWKALAKAVGVVLTIFGLTTGMFFVGIHISPVVGFCIFAIVFGSILTGALYHTFK